MPRYRVRRPLLALIVLLVALAVGYGIEASRHSDPKPSLQVTSTASSGSTVALSALPPQAAQTVALIKQGGPFPYPRNDGVVFGNNEHRLPREVSGYYREYTVPVPGAVTRGTRRIITGKNGEYYYTGDHYEHFQLVEVNR